MVQRYEYSQSLQLALFPKIQDPEDSSNFDDVADWLETCENAGYPLLVRFRYSDSEV